MNAPDLHVIAASLYKAGVTGNPTAILARELELFEVEFEASVLEHENHGVEDVGQCSGDVARFGERPGVGLVLEEAVAVKLEFVEDGGGRAVGCGVVVVGRHGRLRFGAAPLAAFHGRRRAGAAWACTAGL